MIKTFLIFCAFAHFCVNYSDALPTETESVKAKEVNNVERLQQLLNELKELFKRGEFFWMFCVENCDLIIIFCVVTSRTAASDQSTTVENDSTEELYDSLADDTSDDDDYNGEVYFDENLVPESTGLQDAASNDATIDIKDQLPTSGTDNRRRRTRRTR